MMSTARIRRAVYRIGGSQPVAEVRKGPSRRPDSCSEDLHVRPTHVARSLTPARHADLNARSTAIFHSLSRLSVQHNQTRGPGIPAVRRAHAEPAATGPRAAGR